MKFGFLLPTCMEGLNQPPATIRPPDILRIAREAEALGLDSLWANDHLGPGRSSVSRTRGRTTGTRS